MKDFAQNTEEAVDLLFAKVVKDEIVQQLKPNSFIPDQDLRQMRQFYLERVAEVLGEELVRQKDQEIALLKSKVAELENPEKLNEYEDRLQGLAQTLVQKDKQLELALKEKQKWESIGLELEKQVDSLKSELRQSRLSGHNASVFESQISTLSLQLQEKQAVFARQESALQAEIERLQELVDQGEVEMDK